MSVSLYYTAKRDCPITREEQDACQKVVERYIADYPLGEIYEAFCVYDPDTPSEADVIFEGATKLPFDKDQKHFIKVHDYWSECLQEIIFLLPGAQWHIHIDDTDVTPYFDFPGEEGTTEEEASMKPSLPEEFLNITFLPSKEYAEKEFLGKRYRIIGEDDVGNYIGEAGDGTVFLLNTAAEEDQEAIIYFAKDIDTLAQAIQLYRRHREELDPDDEEDEAAFARDAQALAAELTALDPETLRDEFTFWSPLIEEMGYGMI